MMVAAPLRVAILGTTSSGKSTLAEALAVRYQTAWVPEYLREFVDTEGRVPVEADQFHIASTQCAREQAAATGASEYLFCDTAPLMTVVYGRHYFGAIDTQLAALADSHAQQYALTLVTAPDIPWVADGLQRESEAVSVIIHRMLLDELVARRLPYVLVSGTPSARLASVERLLRLLRQSAQPPTA